MCPSVRPSRLQQSPVSLHIKFSPYAHMRVAHASLALCDHQAPEGAG